MAVKTILTEPNNILRKISKPVEKVGNFVGGPMYYIKNGLGEKYAFLSYLFAFFGMIAAFGIGNGVQSNSVAQVWEHY